MRLTSILTAGLVSLTALCAPAAAQCPGDDGLEDNDSCSAAAPAPLGLSTNLQVHGPASGNGVDEDFFVLQVLDGETLSVELHFTHLDGDLDLYLYDALEPTCGQAEASVFLGQSWTLTDDEAASWKNETGSAVDVVIHAHPWGGAFECNDYDLEIWLLPPICSQPDDDLLTGDNDSCATALPLPMGLSTGLQVHGAANASGADPDHWSTSLAQGERLTLALDFDAAAGNIDLFLYDISSGCPGVLIDSSQGVGSGELLTHDNLSGGPLSVVALVAAVGGGFDCNDYAMEAELVAVPCLGPDDALEENDSCATALPLGPGLYTGLHLRGALHPAGVDHDHYSLSLAAGEMAVVDLHFLHAANGNIDLGLYDITAGCLGTYLDSSYSVNDDEQAVARNLGGAPMTVLLWVEAYGVGFECNDYDLEVSTQPIPPCTTDVYEDNDDCGAAIAVPQGLTEGLWVAGPGAVKGEDADFWTATVADGESLSVDLHFSHAEGDLDLLLYAAGDPNCGGGYDPGSNLAFSISATDDESILWANNSGASMEVVLHVDLYDFGLVNDCNSYDLEVVGGSSGLGVPFCFGDGSDGLSCPCGNTPVPGSGQGCTHGAGVGAYLLASGSPTVGADSLTLTILNGEPNEACIFISNIAREGGGGFQFFDGLFCLAADGNLTRHFTDPATGLPIPTILDGAGTGTNVMPLSLSDYNGLTVPGATVHYQVWMRSPGGPCALDANTSSGISILWD